MQGATQPGGGAAAMAEDRDPKAFASDGLGLESRQYEALEQEFQEVRASSALTPRSGPRRPYAQVFQA